MHMKKILFLYRYSTAVKDNLVNKFNGQMDACVITDICRQSD